MPQLHAGHQVDLLQGGGQYFPALVDAIDQSRREVRVETYIFHLDRSGCAVAQALERAALRGVAVYLAMDGVGTPELPTEWSARLDRGGVHWHIFSPLGRVGMFIPSRWRRLHRKLCVVDGQVAFCGGINMLDDYVDPNHGELTEPRLDFSVRVTGPLVEDAHRAMASFWWRLQIASEVNAREFPAAWRGVRVRLLLQGRYEYFLQYHASRPVYGALLAAGVEIHEYAASFLHAKVAVVDMRWATVGSSNLDPLSLLLAREANVVVDDAAFAQDLRERLEVAMAQGGRLLDPQAFADRPWRQRVLEKLAFGLMRLGLLLIGRRY